MYDPRAEWKRAIEVLKEQKAEADNQRPLFEVLERNGEEKLIVLKIQKFIDSEDMKLAMEIMRLRGGYLHLSLQGGFIGPNVNLTEEGLTLVTQYRTPMSLPRHRINAEEMAVYVINSARVRHYRADLHWRDIMIDIQVAISYLANRIVADVKEKEAKK